MITTVRKLNDNDDLSQISKLIYETDNYIFPYLFKDSRSVAKEILPHMILSDTIYNKDNIFVASRDNNIVGIVVINKSPIKINLADFIGAFEKANVIIDENFEKVLKEYYLPLETEPDGYHISNMCVDEMYRGQGIGRALLENIKPYLDPTKDIYIECLADNETALAVYESEGFEILFEYPGFTGLKYYKMVRRALDI